MNEHVFLERTNRTASLSSWIVTAMIDLYVAEQEGLQGYIRWTRELSPSAYQDDEEFSRRSNMWEWYFLQPHCDAIDDSSPIWVWEDTQELLRKHDVSKSILEHLYKERLRFNAEVEAEAEDFVPVQSEKVRLKTGETKELTLILVGGATLSGYVVGEGGGRVAGARIRIGTLEPEEAARPFLSACRSTACSTRACSSATTRAASSSPT
jgi:hypothetical protein